MSAYGTIVTEAQVRNAVKEHLRIWSPAYLAEIARRAGLDAAALPPFRSFITSTEPDSWPEDQLPTCVVIAPGLLGEPARHGRTYSARWAVGVGVVVSGQTREGTSDLVGLYTAAVRALMLQNQRISDLITGVTWTDERYDELGSEDGRTIAAGQVIFGVDIEDALDVMGGPITVPADPLPEAPDWPTTTATDIDVRNDR